METKTAQETSKTDWDDRIKALGLMAFLWVLVSAAVFFGKGFLGEYANLLGRSRYPLLALFFAGGFGSNVLILLVRLADIGIGAFGKVLGSPGLRAYVVALPLSAHLFTAAVALGVLLFITPYCSLPAAVHFEVNGQSYQTGETVPVMPGDVLTIQASPVEQGVDIICQWQQAGAAFDAINATSGCVVTLNIAPRAGQGILTLVASQRFCPQKTFFPLIIQVNNETH